LSCAGTIVWLRTMVIAVSSGGRKAAYREFSFD
jgi:hypothetical protein